MPPRVNSRFTFSSAIDDAGGRKILTDRKRFTYRDLPDNRQHRVTDEETLWGLAEQYFDPLEDAAMLWWIIADFQPNPIHDPTLRLPSGLRLFIPSIRTVQEEVFSERRRQEVDQ